MLGMFFANILNTKIVDYECEGDKFCFVSPQPRYILGLEVAVLVESFLK